MRVHCPTCGGTKKLNIGGRPLDCNVCDEGNGPTGFVDDGSTPEEAAALAAKVPNAETQAAMAEKPTERFETVPALMQALNAAPDRYVVLSQDGGLTKAADTEAGIFEGLEASTNEQFVYKRIAVVKPRTGADIIKEG